jgi:hypothetical protein
MSTRYNDGSHYENHQRAAELHDVAAHAHRVAEQQGKSEHLTGSEHTRLAEERSHGAHAQTESAADRNRFTHDDIAALAHKLWLERGSPEGSPDEDWFHAAEQLRARSSNR